MSSLILSFLETFVFFLFFSSSWIPPANPPANNTPPATLPALTFFFRVDPGIWGDRRTWVLRLVFSCYLFVPIASPPIVVL